MRLSGLVRCLGGISLVSGPLLRNKCPYDCTKRVVGGKYRFLDVNFRFGVVFFEGSASVCCRR